MVQVDKRVDKLCQWTNPSDQIACIEMVEEKVKTHKQSECKEFYVNFQPTVEMNTSQVPCIVC
jgi:hypothetical protein